MSRTATYLVIVLILIMCTISGIYIHFSPTLSKTAWNGGKRYTIESYMDPVFGVQKRVVGVEQPQVEGMVDPVGLAAEIDAISRMQLASFTK